MTPGARSALAFAALIALAATRAAAIDDGFDPSRYQKGGFAPASDETYRSECGSCHFAYLPGMLPARSWRALVADSANHFGESLSLPVATAATIERYLVEHAADRSDYRGSKLMLSRLDDDATPRRITALPLMRLRHVVIRKLQSEGRVDAKLTNCDSCHEKAATGSFAYSQIVVPGVTKVVRPGNLF
jgi:cytochrome c553